MQHFLIPPILTALAALGAAVYMVFKIPPTATHAKLGFTFLTSLFAFGILSVLIYTLKSRKRLGNEDLRPIFKKSSRLALIISIFIALYLLVKLFLF